MGRVPTWVSYEQIRVVGALYSNPGLEYRSLTIVAGVTHDSIYTVLYRLEERGLCTWNREVRPAQFYLTDFGAGLAALLMTHDPDLFRTTRRPGARRIDTRGSNTRNARA